MSAPGLPRRVGRSAFGAAPIARRPTIDPLRELDPAVADLLFHQAAILGMLSPIAVFRFNTTTLEVDWSYAAWAPDMEVTSAPTVTSAGAGTFACTFDVSYLDRDGEVWPTSFAAAEASLMDTTLYTVAPGIEDVAQHVIQLRVYNSSDALATPAGRRILVAAW